MDPATAACMMVTIFETGAMKPPFETLTDGCALRKKTEKDPGREVAGRADMLRGIAVVMEAR